MCIILILKHIPRTNFSFLLVYLSCYHDMTLGLMLIVLCCRRWIHNHTIIYGEWYHWIYEFVVWCCKSELRIKLIEFWDGVLFVCVSRVQPTADSLTFSECEFYKLNLLKSIEMWVFNRWKSSSCKIHFSQYSRSNLSADLYKKGARTVGGLILNSFSTAWNDEETCSTTVMIPLLVRKLLFKTNPPTVRVSFFNIKLIYISQNNFLFPFKF